MARLTMRMAQRVQTCRLTSCQERSVLEFMCVAVCYKCASVLVLTSFSGLLAKGKKEC